MKYSIDGSTLTDIADAIREKTGDTAALTAAAMAEAIAGISGGGGLEYETGEWTPVSAVAELNISFSDVHNDVPAVVCVGLDYNNTFYTNTNIASAYCNFQKVGVWNNAYVYGVAVVISQRSTGSLLTSARQITHSVEDLTDDDTTCPRYWGSTTGFKAKNPSNTTVRWDANRTYKWIAIWL